MQPQDIYRVNFFSFFSIRYLKKLLIQTFLTCILILTLQFLFVLILNSFFFEEFLFNTNLNFCLYNLKNLLLFYELCITFDHLWLCYKILLFY